MYAMYAVLVRRLRAIGVVRVVLYALAVTIVWRLAAQIITTSMPMGQFFHDGHASELSRILYAQLPARCFEWLLGVLIAEAYFGRVKLPEWSRSSLLAIGLLVIGAAIFRHPVGAAVINGHPFMLSDVVLDQFVGIGYAVVLLAAIHSDQAIISKRVAVPLLRGFAFVGLFSYSLYLLHVPMLDLSGRLLDQVGITGEPRMLGRWAFTLLASWGFYALIERHFVDGSADRWTAARWADLRRDRVVEPTRV